MRGKVNRKVKIVALGYIIIFSVYLLVAGFRANDPHHQTRRETIRQLEHEIQNHVPGEVSQRDEVYIHRIHINNLEEKEMILDAIKKARPSRFGFGRIHGFALIIGDVDIFFITFGGARDNLIQISHRSYILPSRDHARLRELLYIYVGDEVHRHPQAVPRPPSPSP